MKTNFLLTIFCFFLLSYSVQSQPKLNSYPSAKATIFIDFDGHFIEGTSWNRGAAFYCQPSGLSNDQIINIFHRVAEDYRPFNVNVTTDSTVYLAAPLARRVRVVVTKTSDWYPGVGGVAYTGSFTWGDDTPAFVFSDKLGYNQKNVAECVSHESGHTLGLSHQAKYNSNCSLVATYNEGYGSGEIGWAPVMGNSYGRNLSGWNNGPTPYGCTQEQDNLSIITSRNGFTYRADDHGNNPNESTKILVKDNLFTAEGIIITNIDKDVFSFNVNQTSKVKLDVLPFSVGPNNEGANLDIKVVLLNETLDVIAEYDPEDVLHVSVDTILQQGIYYAVVSGAGNINTSNYGSLGSYFVKGMLSPTTVLPVNELSLKGKAIKGGHELSWTIRMESAAEKMILEKSSDGIHYSAIEMITQTESSLVYRPEINGNVYYRIRVITQSGNIIYSNALNLKSEFIDKKLFRISTMVRNEINVQASEDYRFNILDMTGRSIQKGTGKAGQSSINIGSSPNGIYFIQMISNTQKITQRIVKL
ncbi:MAG: zinc-dependent metalloprotease [Ginsengibacter sp.]